MWRAPCRAGSVAVAVTSRREAVVPAVEVDPDGRCSSEAYLSCKFLDRVDKWRFQLALVRWALRHHVGEAKGSVCVQLRPLRNRARPEPPLVATETEPFPLRPSQVVENA